MNLIDPDELADGLNRMVKLALDTGEAASLAEAEALFAGYKLHVAVDAAAAGRPATQAALLTIVNAARRTFLGGVTVALGKDVALCVPMAGQANLAAAVTALGGRIGEAPSGPVPCVQLGAARRVTGPFAVRVIVQGWRGGVAPADDPLQLDECEDFIPAAVLAGALAVTEAFLFVRGAAPLAGRRRFGLSLWRPELDWLADEAEGPACTLWPADIWLIGLGNLGQACLWTLGLLPYRHRDKVRLVLQDFDRVALSNDSTSMLTHRAILGRHKTRAMADWAEARGFAARIVERRFQADFKVASDEPAVAFCGVDNGLARRALEEVGFARTIEAGLGLGPRDFLALRLHSFPGPSMALALWPAGAAAASPDLERPAYRDLAAQGADACGLVRLAGRTVGAPFVGTVAACLMVAELVRLTNGQHAHALIDLHLKAPEHRTVLRQGPDFAFNPGGTA